MAECETQQGEDATLEQAVPSRVFRIIKWLLANAEQISAKDRMQITFDCAGPRIAWNIKEGGEV